MYEFMAGVRPALEPAAARAGNSFFGTVHGNQGGHRMDLEGEYRSDFCPLQPNKGKQVWLLLLRVSVSRLRKAVLN